MWVKWLEFLYIAECVLSHLRLSKYHRHVVAKACSVLFCL